MKYINIHRHGPAESDESGIENIYEHFNNPPSSFFSAGIHPWYINPDSWQSDLKKIQIIAADNNMLAVGECGLDKICKTDYIFQQQVFKTQIKLANLLNKPMIIHCVRAHEDVMQILEKENSNMPVIFHGYNNSIALAKKIISKGYYLSLGYSLAKQRMASVFTLLPLHHIFLETDNSSATIKEIYQLAADIKQISIEDLSLQLQQNLKQVFNIEL